MSMPQYPWDLEERTEDALVALLKAGVGRVSMIIAARTVAPARYPLVVVEAQGSENVSDPALFNGRRRISIVVAIVTEAVNNSPELTQPELLETARETHRAFKSAVIGSLASTALQDELNQAGVAGIEFSSAHLTGQSRDSGDGKLTTEQTLEIICSPKEI
jgi:hypothetical protein